MNHATHNNHYARLLGMAVLSFISMYVLMYAMVDGFTNVYPNLNQLYMAGLMTAPMIVIELALMGMMYHNKTWNIAIMTISIAAGILCFFLIRQQSFISDKQFLRSMIPHHASALLMCEQAPLEDPEIQELCENILTGQQAEIDLMKMKLGE